MGQSNGVKDGVLVVSIGFTDEPFHAVAVHSVFKIALGYAYNHLIYRAFVCNRDKIVKTLKGEREDLLTFMKKLFNGDFRAEVFFFRESGFQVVSGGGLHILSRKRP